MLKPPTPVDELLRLETLRKLQILDTDPEERFDRVTRLARRIFDTPIALVSLVDSDRQWFKSRQGLDATETPRDISFCGHAILEDEPMVVSDAAADERFEDNPLVTGDPNIRFYAGYPLSAPDGSKVGTLCIIDREPRDMSADDIGLLAELGQMVEEEFVIASLLHQDAVTGLSNREGFVQTAKHLLAMCRRTDSPASVTMFRLDNQDIIDGTEQGQGDRAAIGLAQILMASFRDSDIVGRISPDVFAVLLAGSGLLDIEKAVTRFAAQLAQRNESDSNDYELDVVSSEVAYHPDRHPDVDTLLEEAIACLDYAHDPKMTIGTATGKHVRSA